jgi:hypothetical protein
LVHGLDPLGPSGADCRDEWGWASDGTIAGMIGWLSWWGHDGPFKTVKYYHGDTNCTSNLHNHGKLGYGHDLHYSSGHRAHGGHTNDTSIRHLGYHLAWAISDYNTRSNVNVVAHSMGGLILRYALAQTARGHRDFPAAIMVKDAVTMGTPHLGSGAALFCAYATQCDEMRNGSEFMDWLARYAQNPQGLYGTNWTLISSENDGAVSQGSGVGMSANHKVIFGEGIGHNDYHRDGGDARDRNVKYDDGNDGYYFHWNDAPHVIRWADRALAATSW